jgi:hypothetical protein
LRGPDEQALDQSVQITNGGEFPPDAHNLVKIAGSGACPALALGMVACGGGKGGGHGDQRSFFVFEIAILPGINQHAAIAAGGPERNRDRLSRRHQVAQRVQRGIDCDLDRFAAGHGLDGEIDRGAQPVAVKARAHEKR